ncbi:MAG: hypothetical protein ACRCWQ_10885 [Bacilli bacterium]
MFELAKQKLQVARKLRDKNTQISLQCLIGDVQKSGDMSNKNVVEVARGHIKSLRFNLGVVTERGLPTEGLEAQIEALQFIMPPELDDDTIKGLIKDAKHIGEAMKTVRAHCQANGFEFDGDRIKSLFLHK